MEETLLHKRRRLDDDVSPQAPLGVKEDLEALQSLADKLQDGPAEPNVRHIRQLEGKLQHLRNWMHQLQTQMQPLQRDTIMNAQRLFIGDVPLGTTDEELSKFLGDAIISTGAAVSSSGRPINYCRVQPGKNFAFVQVRTAEEASNVMALDGIMFKSGPLTVKRPSKFDAQASIMLGPLEPDPTIDLSQVNIFKPALTAAAGSQALGGDQGKPHKYEADYNTLYIGGLPTEWNSDQCLELLKMYGELKHFRLMMDKQTGKPRGFAFVDYTTDEATKAALKALDGAQLGPRRIVANRALMHKEHKEKEFVKQQVQQHMWGGQGGVGAWESSRPNMGAGRGGGRMGPMVRAGRGAGAAMGGAAAGGMMGVVDPRVGAGLVGMQQQVQGAGSAAAAGGGYGMGAVGGQVGSGMQQQVLFGAPAGAGGLSGGAMSGMNAAMGLAEPSAAMNAGAQGMGGSQQGMYAMAAPLQQPAAITPAGSGTAAAAGGYGGMYALAGAGQMQQTGAGMQDSMVGGQMPDQGQAAALLAGIQGVNMPGSNMVAAAGGLSGAGGMAGAYQQQQQPEQQQALYSAALGGGPQLGVGGQVNMPGLQMGAGMLPGAAGTAQLVPNAAAAVASGPPSSGMGPGMGGWHGHPQQTWTNW